MLSDELFYEMDMAGIDKSARSRRRKLRALAEAHLRDLTADDRLTDSNSSITYMPVASMLLAEGDHSSTAENGNTLSSDVHNDDDNEYDFGHSRLNSDASIRAASVQFGTDSDEDMSEQSITADNTESIDSASDANLSSDESFSVTVNQQLVVWVLKFNIPRTAVSALLQILQSNGMNLPKDARTLMQTPKTVDVASIAGGSYFYFGIADAIRSRVSSQYVHLSSGNDIHLHINIDGLPLSRSSLVQLWPLLGTIREIPCCQPFVIALFGGHEKPATIHDFLKHFVFEMNELQKSGIVVNDNFFPCTLLLSFVMHQLEPM